MADLTAKELEELKKEILQLKKEIQEKLFYISNTYDVCLLMEQTVYENEIIQTTKEGKTREFVYLVDINATKGG